MPDASQAVFLSYARDDAAAARRIAEALRSRGIEVWFDENELRGGDAWDAKIRRQIDECQLFLPVVSKHTEERAKGYFRLEWKLAVDQMHLLAAGVPFVVPVVIDEVRDEAARVPPEFLRVQWTRLAGGLPTAEFVERIVQLLAQRAFPPAAGGTAALAAPEAPARRGTSRTALMAAGVALVLALVGGYLYRSRSRPAAPPSISSAPAADVAADKSIAVLPLANLSEDKGFFADGVHDELITDLAAIADLKVISRTSVLQYRDAHENVREIGRQLGVRYIAEGSVRKEGNHVRINAQLIDTRTDTHVWAGTFDKELADVFALQAVLAQEIAAALQARLTPAEQKRITRERGAPPEVYELAQRARTIIFATKSTRQDYAMALDLAQEAVRREPGFAYGWATVGHVDVAIIYRGFEVTEARRKAAKVAIDRALQLDPDLPEAHWALGRWAQVSDFADRNLANSQKSLGELQLAEASMPNEPRVLSDISSVVYYQFNDTDRAVALQRRAVELNPQDPLSHYNLARMFYWVGRYEDALVEFDAALRLDSTFFGAACFKAETLIRARGDLTGAQAAIDALPATMRDDRVIYYRYLMAYYRRDFAAALRILRESPVAFFYDNTVYAPREYCEGITLLRMGRAEEARAKLFTARTVLEAMRKVQQREDTHFYTDAILAAALGDEAGAEAGLAKLDSSLGEMSRQRYIREDCRAHVYTLLGKPGLAIAQLELLVHREKTESAHSLALSPDWDVLRGNPSFEALCR